MVRPPSPGDHQGRSVRLRWDTTPVDVFFDTTSFHGEVAQRVRKERFGGSWVPFLACRDLAVFKAFFNRTQDWADLENMVVSRSFDVEVAADTLAYYVGADDPRVHRLRRLPATSSVDPGSWPSFG